MKKKLFATSVLLAVILLASPAQASTRYIVRNSLGYSAMKLTCSLLGCNVSYGAGDPLGQVFLVTTPDSVNPVTFLIKLLLQPGVKNAELDLPLFVSASSVPGAVPDALYDNAPVEYYGTTVWNGYVNQPATQIIRRAEANRKFGVDGQGVVAIIDTGIDPEHPAFQDVLTGGYDFTRDKKGGSEAGDVTQSTAAVLDGAEPAFVNQSTAAVLDQSTAAVLDDPKHAAFGHGTMVAGIVHLVAPQAKIMPLKAFRPDGSGYTCDVIRAIYYAARNGANVVNMSFSFSTPSAELTQAVNHASKQGIVLVASVGNEGQRKLVFPAGYDNVIGVASTTDFDSRSSFSNYGAEPVWVAAPGEAIVTTYPYRSYAAAWGTSFSTPFVSGTVALLLDVKSGISPVSAAEAVSNARWISDELGHGRLDVYRAVAATKQ